MSQDDGDIGRWMQGEPMRVELVNAAGDRWSTEISPQRAIACAGELLMGAGARIG